MKKPLTLFIALVIIVVLGLYMFTFTVRYDEVAVRATFEAATEPTIDPATGEVIDPGSLFEQPGIYFKWPWPIQSVYQYSTKLNVVQDQFTEVQTRDGKALIVQLFAAWNIDDPYAFFRTVRTDREANTQMRNLMKALSGVIGNYDFDQMVNTDAGKLRLSQIEADLLDQLRIDLAKAPSGYGIEVKQVGIRRLVLPENTTANVFAAMRSARESLAQNARSQGEARATEIRTEAESIKQIILAFADRRAQAIRTEGDEEAATYFAVFDQNPQLAEFLRQIEAMKQYLSNNTTFILSAQDIGLQQMLDNGAGAVAGQADGDRSAARP